jgi:predicted GH43/DUF377 family glycosyl hydrolase
MVTRQRRDLARRLPLAATLVAALATGPTAAADASVPAADAAHPTGSAAVTAAGDASYTAGNLPDWAIGPFARSTDNPVLHPSGTGFEAAAAYNPGVLYSGGEYKMLYRGQPAPGGPSQIGYASSPDGIHFTEDAAQNPVISTATAGDADKCGLEDPRLYQLGRTYYSFFTSVHPKTDGSCYGSYDISESTSTDAIHWTAPRIVEPAAGNNKDASVVTNPRGAPVRIDGEYVMYFGQGNTGTYIAYSQDMLSWHAKANTTPRTADQIDVHYPGGWQPWEVCVAVTDYKTVAGRPVNHGIVLFTAGTLMANKRWFYAISEVEMSRDDPGQVQHQLSDAVLTPTPDVPYEWNGQTPKTVWMNSIFMHNGVWRMYYGGGDTVTGLATADLRRPAPAPAADTPFQTGFEHGQAMPDWIDRVDTGPGGGGVANVAAYGRASSPESSVRQEINHDGTNALVYSGRATGAADDHAYLRLFDLSARPAPVGRDTTLSYWIYPQATSSSAPDVTGDNSSCVALDLVFTDGAALHDLTGSPLTPASECGTLQLDRWNHITVDLGNAVAGKQIARIDLGYDQPGSTGGYRGYVDDIAITNDAARPATIGSVSPAQAAPGQQVTVTGTGFGPTQANGELILSDNGVNWGGAGDLGTLPVDAWSDTSITFTVPKPSGPAVSTASGPQNLWRVEPGTTATVAVASGPAATSNTAQVGIANSAVVSDYFDDIGVAPDANPGCGAYDDGTDTYSADALATAAPNPLRPGSRVSIDGLGFTWPDAPPCTNDNVRALGQTILLAPHASADKIGFLGAATNGNKSGAVTINYSDGTSSTASLAQTDWGNPPGAGNQAVAETAYRNQATGPNVHNFYVDEQSIAVDPDRTVASITLPNQRNLHIFAVAENGQDQ